AVQSACHFTPSHAGEPACCGSRASRAPSPARIAARSCGAIVLLSSLGPRQLTGFNCVHKKKLPDDFLRIVTSRSNVFAVHDLFGKPVSTFRDHARTPIGQRDTCTMTKFSHSARHGLFFWK